MSRPPRFRTAYSTTGEPSPGRPVLDYLPDEFADLVEEERSLASAEIGFPPTSTEGDFAGTLMEIAALLGHTLGSYQDRYANDAFLGTARSAKSLVRHGRRLAYEPGPGLASTGFAILVVKDGLSGAVKQGLALGSAPVGEKKAQDYETLEDLAADAAFGEIYPYDAMVDVTLGSDSTFALEGTGLRIEEGDVVVVQVGTSTSAHLVTGAPVETDDQTTLEVSPPLPAGISDPHGAILWAKPAHDVHLFGWDTSSSSFLESELQGGVLPTVITVYPASGYTVTPGYDANDLYLSEEFKKPISSSPGVRIDKDGLAALSITKESSKNVTFSKVSHVVVKVPKNPATPAGDQVVILDETPAVSVSKTVTAIQASANGGAVTRSSQAIRASRWLLGFRLTVPLVTQRPNAAVASTPDALPVRLDREVLGLEPGRLIALCARGAGDSGRFEIVRLTSVGFWDDGSGVYRTQVTWQPVEPRIAGAPWELGELRVVGNVVRISHGKTVSEVLGDSDGSSPFLRFTLKQKPLTYLPSSSGAQPAFSVRVSDVLWTRVVDFESSSPDDRHYLLQRDENGTVTVLFGDGSKGAIPSSGKKHIAATYRTGIGPDGDAPAFAVSRLKKAHALLERAYNPLAVQGSAAPAQSEDVRTQATGFIRTFDRAVSVEDHRQLALLFPGVAKASAVWTTLPDGAQGILVVVADAAGTASTAASVEAFLRSRRDDTVPLAVIGLRLLGLTITLYLEIDPAYLKENVERAVRDALASASEDAPGLFAFAARDLGQPAFLSQVYERIERAPGVRFVDVRRFDTLEEVGKGTPIRVVDTVVARSSEVLLLAAQDIHFLPAEAT